MRVECKEDWEEAQQRIDAFWNGEIIDRAVVQVMAPRMGIHRGEIEALQHPVGVPADGLLGWFTAPDQVVPRLEALVESVFWGGEAMPHVLPVSVNLVAIPAAFLGCPYRLTPDSGWASPIIDDWTTRPHFAFDPHNEWWLIAKRLLAAVAERAAGRYYVGVPDLNAPTEIVALLRGTQRMLVDMLERPEIVKECIDEVNLAWLRYWQASIGVIHQWVGDYVFWMGIPSDRPAIDLQSDFSCMISPEMFNKYFLPSIEQQTQWVERTIYHLDGPNAIRHLDALLSLPRLTGIQWVPGDGAPPMSKWIRLLRRIQAGGKRLVLSCAAWEVETLLAELEPEGLLLSTWCATEEEARDLLRHVPRWTACKRWVVA
jgi:5-methyltetrahydrofolate--homocysteine methyltransferase